MAQQTALRRAQVQDETRNLLAGEVQAPPVPEMIRLDLSFDQRDPNYVKGDKFDQKSLWRFIKLTFILR